MFEAATATVKSSSKYIWETLFPLSKMDEGERLYQEGLALVVAERYCEALPVFERASDAGSGVASFEVAMAYHWRHYGTHWYRGNTWEQFVLFLTRAALEQNFLPALAHLCNVCKPDHPH